MSKLQFSRLRHGDVLLWGRWPNVIKRTVIEGPVDIAKSRGEAPIDNLHVVFAIRKRSWTKRARTSYGWNDVKHKVRATGKRRRTVISVDEMDRLKRIKFDPQKEYRREIRERIGQNKRMNRVCAFEPAPLPRG